MNSNVFDRSAHRTGYEDYVLTYDEIRDGLEIYRRKYGTMPNLCAMTYDARSDMYSDTVLSDMYLDEITIVMNGGIDWERKLQWMDEQTTDDAVALFAGCSVVLVDGNEPNVLFCDTDYDVEDRSVAVLG